MLCLCDMSVALTFCSNTQNNGTAGLMYSTGWPTKYLPSVSNCTYVIQPPYSGLGVLISFMDIDVNPSVDHGDCVKLFGKQVIVDRVLTSNHLSFSPF